MRKAGEGVSEWDALGKITINAQCEVVILLRRRAGSDNFIMTISIPNNPLQNLETPAPPE